MRYQISGQQINIGDALKEHVKSALDDVVSKYAQRPTDISVVFSKSGHEHVCEITIHLSTGLNAAAKARDNEIYASFENSCEKLDKQLRRYKRRLKDHHKERLEPVELIGASSYVLSGEHSSEVNEPEDLQPVIIAETEAKIPSISVGEAVMQMELAGSEFLVFKNEVQSTINVVYRRDDGNIGWIEPQ